MKMMFATDLETPHSLPELSRNIALHCNQNLKQLPKFSVYDRPINMGNYATKQVRRTMPKRKKMSKKARIEGLRAYRIRAIRLLFLMVILVGLVGIIEYRVKAITTVDNLTLNYQTDPTGIESDGELVFGWRLNSVHRGAVQNTYCINVYEASERGPLVWTSGVVSSGSGLIRESYLGLGRREEACVDSHGRTERGLESDIRSGHIYHGHRLCRSGLDHSRAGRQK